MSEQSTVTDDQASALLADAVAAAGHANTDTASPLHDDPVIAAALEGLTPAQRETLLTTGGQKALAAERGDAKTARAEATAAKAAQDAITLSIGKALGLVKDDDPVDSAAVAQRLAESGADARQARVELAVYRAAGTIADPGALLDSTSFLASLKDIDPTDSAAITAAITAAVESNPRLGAASEGPRAPRPDLSQASGANGKTVTSPASEFASILQSQLGSRG